MSLARKLVPERRADGTICQGQAARNAAACLLSFFQTSIICLCECFCKPLPVSGSTFLSVLVWRDPCRVGDYTSVKFKRETSVAAHEGGSLKVWCIDEKITDYTPEIIIFALHLSLQFPISLAPSDLLP